MKKKNDKKWSKSLVVAFYIWEILSWERELSIGLNSSSFFAGEAEAARSNPESSESSDGPGLVFLEDQYFNGKFRL